MTNIEFKLGLLASSKLLSLKNKLTQMSHEDYGLYLKSLRLENLDFLHLIIYPNLKLPIPTETILEYKREKILNEEYKKIIVRLRTTISHKTIIFFKGLLNDRLIGHTSYKRRSDIDLLIFSDFRKTLQSISNSLDCDFIKMQNYGEFTLKTPQGSRIDVHYNLLSSTPFVFKYKLLKGLLSNTSTCHVDDTEVLVFNIEFTLIYQIIHFAIQHSFSEFILLFEISEIIKKNQEKINIDYFIKLIHTHNVELPVSLVFLILEDKVEYNFFQNKKIKSLLRSNEDKLKLSKERIEKNLFQGTKDSKFNLNHMLSENFRNILLNYLRTAYLYLYKLTFYSRKNSVQKIISIKKKR